MSFKPVLYKILAAIMIVTILSGCNAVPAPASTPTAAPTIIAPTTAPMATTAVPTETIAPTVDQNLVSTQAAQTAAANLTLNAPTATPVTPTSTPTATPTATLTFTPLPPTLTFTPLPPTALPTATLIPWTLTPIATPTGYNCSVTSTTPKSTDTVKVSTDFNWSWVIQNTGIKTWGQHNADLKYVSGTAMQTAGNLFNLTSDVTSGASYTATIAMETPSTAGTYTATWQIVQDSVLVCTLNLSVRVTY
jgi:hypothetical protein